MKISREEVLRIAQMSRLTVHEDEIDGLVEQLEQVLSYAERVTKVAADAAEPSTKNVNVFREDVVVVGDTDAIRAQAPDKAENYFVVPAILEGK